MAQARERSIWSGRYSKYRSKNPPAWEAFSVPLVGTNNTVQTFDQCGLMDLHLDPMQVRGIDTPFSIVSDACGDTERIVQTLRYPFLTHRELCVFADDLIGLPPAGVSLDDCGGTMTLAYEIGNIQIKDETLRLAFVIEHVGVRKKDSSISYFLFREYGRETLAFGDAGGKAMYKIKHRQKLQGKFLDAVAAMWRRRDRVLKETTEQLEFLSDQSRTPATCYELISDFYPYTSATAEGVLAAPSREIVYAAETKRQIRKWRRYLSEAFIQGNGKYLDTEAAYGTLLGLWFTVGELENFKAASHQAAAQMLLSGKRALQIRKAYLRLLKANCL